MESDCELVAEVAFAASDCDEEEEGIDAAWITFADTVAAALSDKSIRPSDILINNAATVCIVNNPALLEDLAILRVVSGVGGLLPRGTSTSHRKSALQSRLWSA